MFLYPKQSKNIYSHMLKYIRPRDEIYIAPFYRVTSPISENFY